MRSVSCGSLPLVAAYSAGLSVVDGRCCGMLSCAGYYTGDRSFPGMRRYSSMMQQLVFSYGALGVGIVSSIASCWSILPISMMGMLLEGVGTVEIDDWVTSLKFNIHKADNGMWACCLRALR